MALQVQWATGFEDLAAYTPLTGTSENKTKNMMIGWDTEFFNETANTNYYSWVQSSSAPHLRGYWASSGLEVTSNGMIPRHFRPATPNNKMVLGFAYCMKSGSTGTINNRFSVGFRGGSDYIHFRPVKVGSIWYAGLYVNNVLQSTGTAVDISTGSPWVYIELFINKTAGTATIKVSGVNECSATLPAGFNPTDCEVTISDTGTWNGHSSNGMDDIVHYIDSDPVGIIKVDGFYKDGTTMSSFSDGTDNGSTNTNGINNTGYYGYRASSTPGNEDRFSYSTILPDGIDVNSILAVIPSVIASTGSYSQGNLEMRFVSGSTIDTTDVSTKLQPYTPKYIQGPVYHTDPNTGADWVRSNVRGIQTGYRVKS